MGAGIDGKKLVAILVPVWDSAFSDDQLISLAHLEQYLAGYDRFLLKPRGLDVNRRGYRVREFPTRYFDSPETYNSLLKTRSFYEAFSEYEFILIYQLDCLVFRDELKEWCARDYDYVGAPWHKDLMRDKLWWSDGDCVGNGGFSLRKVAGFLDFLTVYHNRRNRIERKLKSLWTRAQQIVCEEHFLPGVVAMAKRKYSMLTQRVDKLVSGAVHEPPVSASAAEDIFFSVLIPKYLPRFRFAPPEVALRFSFEASPEFCYEKNSRQLPFGCHGWDYYNRKFWEPFLLTPRQPAPQDRSNPRGERSGRS